jgi:uncharacterized membrane protein
MKSKISAGTMSASLGLAGGFVRAAAAASAVVTFSVGSAGSVGLGLLGIGGVLSAYCQVAHAGNLTICNNTRQKLDVAIAYNASAAVAGGGWISQGWWAVNQCGGCVQVLTQKETASSQVYLRAEASGVEVFGGNTPFCIDDSPFVYTQTSSCKKRGFMSLQVDLNKHFTQSLNGNVGNSCAHL